MVIAFTSIPVILLSPFMGSLIDKFGRRRVAIWFELGQGLAVILVPIFNNIWGIGLVSLIVLSVIKMVFGPGSQTARKALVPDVAEKAGLTLDRANSVHESVFAAGFAVGPAIASFLIASIDVYAAFWAAGAAAASGRLRNRPCGSRPNGTSDLCDHGRLFCRDRSRCRDRHGAWHAWHRRQE